LESLNTFGIRANAEGIKSFQSVSQLQQILKWKRETKTNCLVLGGGSNVLFTKNFPGWILKNEISGKKILKTESDKVLIEVGAGERWHEWVLWSITSGFFGLENLALIPGSVGAAPIQNIGAYGVEVGELIEEVEAYDLKGIQHRFKNAECQFGYRDSVFKRLYQDELILTKVTFNLSTQPNLKLHYGSIQEELKAMGVVTPSPNDVAQAVIRIRKSKLPEPSQLGNAGSFFKNPTIGLAQFEKLKKNFPNIPHYTQAHGEEVKLAAAWLIEQSGWKGKSLGQAAVHQNQALVLVNLGAATGKEVLELSVKIVQSVFERFNIELTPEVRIL